MSDGRVGAAEYATRVNTAAALAAAGMGPAEAAEVLATRYAVSARQARRYLEAASAGPVPVPAATVVFTVRIPGELATRTRAHAAACGHTISAVVTSALEGHLRRCR
jgi:hypothetical protein